VFGFALYFAAVENETKHVQGHTKGEQWLLEQHAAGTQHTGETLTAHQPPPTPPHVVGPSCAGPGGGFREGSGGPNSLGVAKNFSCVVGRPNQTGREGTPDANSIGEGIEDPQTKAVGVWGKGEMGEREEGECLNSSVNYQN